MRTGLLAKKLGMTRVFDQTRKHNSVTVLEIPDAKVLKLRSLEKDGYNALVIGFEKKPSSKLKNPEKKFFSKLKTEPVKKIKEFRVSQENLVESGSEIDVSHFVVGQFVDVKATSIGKGFAGGMKRHNFSGLRASHGVSVSHRSHGSTGNSQDPGKVWKGKKMAGQLGNKTVSIQNLEVVSIDEERSLLLVKGGVPGSIGGWVAITDAKKKILPPHAPTPIGNKNAKNKDKNIEIEQTKSNETKSNDNENIEANKNEKALDKENIKEENISNQPNEKDNSKVAKDVK